MLKVDRNKGHGVFSLVAPAGYGEIHCGAAGFS
jgi:hypothetical protein